MANRRNDGDAQSRPRTMYRRSRATKRLIFKKD